MYRSLLSILLTYVKVKNPEQYGFLPKELLGKVTDIYLHLNSDELARAVATDEVWKECFTFD